MVNSLDVIIIIIIFAGAYLGYCRGLLAEVIALVGVILGISLASRFYLQVAEVLLSTLRNQEVTLFIAFLVLYAVGVLAFFLIQLVVKSNMAGGAIGLESRFPAAVLGGVKSAVFVALVLFLVIFFWGPENSFTSGGKLLPRFLPHCKTIVMLLPETMQTPLDEFLNDLSVGDEKGETSK